MLEVAKYNEVMETAYEELAPHKVCAYIYDVANAFNRFYHETKILSEENEARQKSYLSLIHILFLSLGNADEPAGLRWIRTIPGCEFFCAWDFTYPGDIHDADGERATHILRNIAAGEIS